MSGAEVGWPGEEFLCGCNTESLRVCGSDGEVDLSFWSFGTWNGRLRWRDRPRWIWRVLVHGQPFADQISLDEDNTRRLAMLLDRIAGVWTLTNASTAGTPFQIKSGKVPPFGTYTGASDA